MSSLRSHEGYLLIDNRNGPPVSAEIMRDNGLPDDAGLGKFEAPSYTCKHCTKVVFINPKRTRDKPRAYCKGCNHLICDLCEARKVASGVCKTFDQIADEARFAAEKQHGIPQTTSLLIPERRL